MRENFLNCLGFFGDQKSCSIQRRVAPRWRRSDHSKPLRIDVEKGMRNAEYIAVVAEAVQTVRRSMEDQRLPELTPEQLAWWFRTITASDIQNVLRA